MSFGLIWCESFDYFGGSTDNMLDGLWAGIAEGGLAADGTARTGDYYYFTDAQFGGGIRRVLGGSYTDLFIGFGFRVPSLPPSDTAKRAMVTIRDGANSGIASIGLTTTGAVRLTQGAANGAVIATTNTPVVVPDTWHYVELHWKAESAPAAGDGAVTLQVDGVTVLTATGITWTNENAAEQLNFGVISNGGTSSYVTHHYDDLVVRDGSVVATFAGDLRVATLYPGADTETAGFTPRYRRKFGNGILKNPNTNSCATLAQSTLDNLGSADYTLETFVRFLSLPTGSNKAVLFGKWAETGNQRSYQLYLGGPSLDSGQLCFRISTDGQAGTVSQLILWPWEPEPDRWYHVAISRVGGETRLFIGGVLQISVADANAYFAASAVFSLGADNTGTANTAVVGHFDEARMTPGVGRYTATFAPPAQAFPRNAIDDPSYNSVAFLAGFDNSVADESSNGRTVTARNGAVQETPDDGTGAFTTLNQTSPRDDTFVEAALIAAKNTFILADLPANGDTVTVGTKAGPAPAVYTFVNALASAFDVLIGADIQSTIENLAAAIVQGVGEGVVYGTGTTANLDVESLAEPGGQCLVTALTSGSTGNAIASTTTAANGSWIDGATLAGGADIPGNSEFTFTRLPLNTTVIKAMQLTSRSYKSDAGSCSYRVSFKGPGGAVAAGADRSLTVDPTYYTDIFDTDPDTAGAITPTTLISGRVRLSRSA